MAPSPGKTWLVAPWETELRPIPDDLVRWLHENKQRCSGKEATKSNRPTVSDPTFDDAWSVPIELQAATALAEELVVNLGDLDSRFYKQEGNSLYFKTGRARSCPYSRGKKGDTHSENNFSLKFRSDGKITYYCFGADCKKEYAEHPAVVGRWKSAEEGDSVSPSMQLPVWENEALRLRLGDMIPQLAEQNATFRLADQRIHFQCADTRGYITISDGAVYLGAMPSARVSRVLDGRRGGAWYVEQPAPRDPWTTQNLLSPLKTWTRRH